MIIGNKFLTKATIVLVVFTVYYSCVNSNFKEPTLLCVESNNQITFEDLFAMYNDGVLKITSDYTIEGYVISSDKQDNFFGELILQNTTKNPTAGILISIDVFDSHVVYPENQKVSINLNGLYLGKQNDSYKIGSAFTSFGNTTIGRIPARTVQNKVQLTCNNKQVVEPKKTTINTLSDALLNILITIDSLEFSESDLNKSFANKQTETTRTMVDCSGSTIQLLTSGYATFQENILPNNNGTVTGILVKNNNKYQIRIRTLNDVNFTNSRCPVKPTEFTSTNIFISEIADPNNNSGARFVELYNAGTEALNLKNWQLVRYTNANTTVSSTIDLSEFIIQPQSTLVISPNTSVFEATYGFLPDMAVSTNSPADSNGDDNLQLIDPFGTVIDTFGVIGEDGSGTNHEFEDGRALRKSTISTANSIFTFSEWIISNDTGESGTANAPQNAPDDFTPGARN